MQIKRTVFFFLFSTLFFSVSAQTKYIYVSPSGNDNSTGNTVQLAFKTLEQAQIQIRKLLKEGNQDSIIVQLGSGVYPIRKPLIFTEEDSAPQGKAIVFKGKRDGKTLLSGGEKITGWRPYKNGIWAAKVNDVKNGSRKFRQLFVNDSLRQRARIIDTGFYRVAGFPDGGAEINYQTPCGRFQFAGGNINSKWKNLQDVEVIVYHFWTDTHLPIQSVDTKTNIVTFQKKSGKVFTDDFTKEGARYIVENVFEGLDRPGEWYLDRTKGELYYKPMRGEDMRTADVIAPFVPEFIRIDGKPVEGKYISNLVFENITFKYSNWDLPPGNSNDGQGSVSVPAAITLKGAQNCVFENCTISNIGTFAFDLGEGCRFNKVQNCNLTHLAAGGLRVSGGTEKAHPLLRTGSNEIRNNLISNYGEIFPSAVGVLLMNTDKTTVSHNEISYGSYTGISIGWVWGYSRSISNHNNIEYNYIHHIGSKGLLSDMGGVYTLGVSPGTVIRNNIIHDVNANHYGGWGIYNDEGSTHILVENNLVYNTKFAPYNIHYAKEITVRNNIFALGKLEQLNRTRVDPHKSVFFENNIVYWKTGTLLSQNWQDKDYKFYASPMGGEREMTSTFDSDYNLFYNPGLRLDSVKFNGAGISKWRERGKDIHSVYSDPLFVDADRYNFNLKPQSPAFGLGFTAIDFSATGIERAKK